MSSLVSEAFRVIFSTTFLNIFIFTIGFGFVSKAQDIPLSKGKQYTIGNIEVTGSSTFNTKTIVAYSGLREGQLIYLPGDVISKTIKKLWALGLFKDVNIYITNVEDNVADLELNIVQLPLLNEIRIDGITKAKSEDFTKENKLSKGSKVTENLITTTKNYIRNHYKEKGYLNTKVISNISEPKDTVLKNAVNVLFKVDRGERVKINEIVVTGNEKFSDSKVKKQLKKTKKKFPLRFWKRSKYIVEDYKEGKQNIIDKYKEKGYRDARIISDSVAVVSDELIDIHLNIEEGKRYYFGDISFLGNSVYSDEQLQRKLVLKKGDVYNGVLLEKRIADNEKPDADDITNLYQNNGYFFSTINPVETNVRNDSIIDFEIRINEGKLAYFNNITVIGNDRTNDHVVYRNIRTNPGDVYSKEKIIRTIRELGQTTFFDTEQLTPNFKNVDQNAGTIDVEYSVVEKGSSQFELQGGYGGTGFIGTLGLSFNNFSIRNIFNKQAYRPLPSGDGQTLSLRAQASQSFRTYYIQFIEPWLGGKKPFQLSTTFRHTQQFNFNFTTGEVDTDQSFLLTGGSVGIAKRLKWPDDYFTLSQTIGFQHYDLKNFSTGLFTFGNGEANDLSYTFGLVRDNTSVSPIFPTGGSRLAFSAKATFPYSLFGDTDWADLAEERAEEGIDADRVSEIDQQRFKWLEYYKIKFSGDWYTSLPKKFVFKSSFQFGFLGAYNQDRGIIPFERFQLGGSGLGVNSGIASLENVALRGYPDAQVVSKSRDLSGDDITVSSSGSPLYNKYSLELRYPVSFNPTATIYALTFLEAGAAYDNFRQFDPFDLNRSAGVGIRIFMPAFGLLGIDWAYGFDPLSGGTEANGSEIHFVLGQQF